MRKLLKILLRMIELAHWRNGKNCVHGTVFTNQCSKHCSDYEFCKLARDADKEINGL